MRHRVVLQTEPEFCEVEVMVLSIGGMLLPGDSVSLPDGTQLGVVRELPPLDGPFYPQQAIGLRRFYCRPKARNPQ